MKILAIETSCDDTCVAILEIRNSKLEILSNIVSSQVKLHQKYGGVYPFLAKREHQKNLPIVFEKALKGANLLSKKIDLIAVTNGPGLEPCLWVGVNFAKDLAEKIKKPVLPVNHIEAHIFVNFLNYVAGFRNLFPAVCLVVSGGHTQLILMKGFGKYKILGETRDDAAGECFDKTARILGLGYPGGPAIARCATQWRLKLKNKLDKKSNTGRVCVNLNIKLPRPMIYQKNYDFSFSGLKTAVLYLVKELTEGGKNLTLRYIPRRAKLTIDQKRGISAEIQQAIIDVLIHKTLKAAKDYKAKTIILGGGVAANRELRKQFTERIKKEMPSTKFYIPDSKFCTDNAAMVAVVGYFNYAKKRKIMFKNIKADANLKLFLKN